MPQLCRQLCNLCLTISRHVLAVIRSVSDALGVPARWKRLLSATRASCTACRMSSTLRRSNSERTHLTTRSLQKSIRDPLAPLFDCKQKASGHRNSAAALNRVCCSSAFSQSFERRCSASSACSTRTTSRVNCPSSPNAVAGTRTACCRTSNCPSSRSTVVLHFPFAQRVRGFAARLLPQATQAGRVSSDSQIPLH